MGINSKIDCIQDKFELNRRAFLISIGEKRNVRRKKHLISRVTLSKEQKNLIDKFFTKHYGKKISHSWHRLYQSYTNTFCHDYFPEILFSTKLEMVLNPNRKVAELIGDKNMIYTLFGNQHISSFRLPKKFVSSVRGVLTDENGNLVEKINNLPKLNGEYVVKKTIDTSSGRDICICNFQDGLETQTGKSQNEIFACYGNDFVVQERIKQSDSLNKIYDKSLNTFRIMTYILDGKIYHCPVALRLGRNGADRDNIHYGGLVIGVRDNGNLRNEAYSEFGEHFSEHPNTGVKFNDIVIKDVGKILDVAKQLHKIVPWLGIISWDMALDENDNVVCIEMNTCGQSAWFPQMVNGYPLFGENTSRMLNLISKRKFI